MTYRKNLTLTIIALFCFVLFLSTFFYCLPRLSLLSSNTLTATVSSSDGNGTSGYVILKVNVPREDGGTVFFHYYYPGKSSHLKQGTEVLISGNIVFMDQSTELGVNSDLVIGTKLPIIVCLVLSVISTLGAVFLFPLTIRNFIHKPWNGNEEVEIKTKTVNFLYTTEIFVLVIALIIFIMGITQLGGYLRMKEHTTGIVTYQSSRQSSQFVKIHGGNQLYNLESSFGKGIRPNYIVLQIKADSLINGVDEFWYEGNNLVLSNKKVYIGYNDEAISVLSQAELMFVYIGGGFLILHVVSAILISKRNKFGGKIFWFFKF